MPTLAVWSRWAPDFSGFSQGVRSCHPGTASAPLCCPDFPPSSSVSGPQPPSRGIAPAGTGLKLPFWKLPPSGLAPETLWIRLPQLNRRSQPPPGGLLPLGLDRASFWEGICSRRDSNLRPYGSAICTCRHFRAIKTIQFESSNRTTYTTRKPKPPTNPEGKTSRAFNSSRARTAPSREKDLAACDSHTRDAGKKPKPQPMHRTLCRHRS